LDSAIHALKVIPRVSLKKLKQITLSFGFFKRQFFCIAIYFAVKDCPEKGMGANFLRLNI
jgi:nucleoside-specific outer membrane channel protein Tsx